jgi:hypothetical protein
MRLSLGTLFSTLFAAQACGGSGGVDPVTVAPMAVEEDAWDFANECAHAGPDAMIGGEVSLFRFRALQATFGRIIVGVANLHDSYVDYSTPGFPSRSVSQTVGGEGGVESSIMRLRSTP